MKAWKGKKAMIRGAFSSTLLVCLALEPSPATGQEGPVLSLDEALDRAVQNSPDYRRAVNNLELSDAERMQAWGAYLPTLSIGTNTGVSLNRQLISVLDDGILQEVYSSGLIRFEVF